MSAGGLSYSGLTSYGKATLPSVSSWGTNNNILRDPPKSIHTRRIDRVGQTSDITRMIDSSGDRVCEAILQYPRGVNPMVGVSYGNFGGNAGTSGNPTSRSGHAQASLPYKIEVFRPPILRQENLLPLSRLPRDVTFCTTNPSEVDFSKKMMCPDQISFIDPEPVLNSQFRQIKTDVFHTPVRPNAVYNYEEPISEPYEVKYVIQNPIMVSANSGIRSIDLTQQEVKVPSSNINDNYVTYGMGTQVAFPGEYKNGENLMNTDRYIQDGNYSAIGTNPCQPRTSPINEIGEVLVERYLQDPNYSSRTASVSGYEDNNYIHDEIYLENKTPYYSMSTNASDPNYSPQPLPDYVPDLQRNTPTGHMISNVSDYGETQLSSREYHLPSRPKYGSFENHGFVPSSDRQQQNISLNSQKSSLSEKVFNQMMGRSPIIGSSMTKSKFNQNRIPQNHIGPQTVY